jgi:hypothetical protein
MTPEYFCLLRSQIKDGTVKEPTHLDSLGLLKERIANLEQEQITLRSTSVGDKRRIKDLEDGITSFLEGSHYRITKTQKCTG